MGAGVGGVWLGWGQHLAEELLIDCARLLHTSRLGLELVMKLVAHLRMQHRRRVGATALMERGVKSVTVPCCSLRAHVCDVMTQWALNPPLSRGQSRANSILMCTILKCTERAFSYASFCSHLAASAFLSRYIVYWVLARSWETLQKHEKKRENPAKEEERDAAHLGATESTASENRCEARIRARAY